MSANLVMIVPSRGRPDAAYDLAHAFDLTCEDDTTLVFVVDEDDPTASLYPDGHTSASGPNVLLLRSPGSTMVAALNYAALRVADDSGPFAIGFMGDDHRPRTVGWDRAYVDALRKLGTGIVYGNDLLQGERIPTQVAMTADIVRALGHMAPPTLTHLFVDNYWKSLGLHASCLCYLPDVVVEHMHPVAGKADWDDGHKRVNAPQMYERDAKAYSLYVDEHLSADVAKVCAL